MKSRLERKRNRDFILGNRAYVEQALAKMMMGGEVVFESILVKKMRAALLIDKHMVVTQKGHDLLLGRLYPQGELK